jgi:hypothetical protein
VHRDMRRCAWHETAISDAVLAQHSVRGGTFVNVVSPAGCASSGSPNAGSRRELAMARGLGKLLSPSKGGRQRTREMSTSVPLALWVWLAATAGGPPPVAATTPEAFVLRADPLPPPRGGAAGGGGGSAGSIAVRAAHSTTGAHATFSWQPETGPSALLQSARHALRSKATRCFVGR